MKRSAYLLMSIATAALAGCATGGKAKTEPVVKTAVVETKPAPLPAGPKVVRFTDGQEGFVITEHVGMDAQARADFDQGVAMMKQGQFDKAVELLEKVTAQWPEVTSPHINLAAAYSQLKKPEQAEQHLKKALELIPGHPVASNEYGLLLRKEGRFAESRLVYEKSLAQFPEFHPIHKNLAILCDLYLKDLACAIEQYQMYSKAMPKDPQVKLWLADLQTRSGK